MTGKKKQWLIAFPPLCLKSFSSALAEVYALRGPSAWRPKRLNFCCLNKWRQKPRSSFSGRRNIFQALCFSSFMVLLPLALLMMLPGYAHWAIPRISPPQRPSWRLGSYSCGCFDPPSIFLFIRPFVLFSRILFPRWITMWRQRSTPDASSVLESLGLFPRSLHIYIYAILVSWQEERELFEET